MTPDFDAIADRIATQDNAGTSDPYFVVFEGSPRRPRRYWEFVDAFLTRAGAEAYIDGHRHHLRNPFIWVESAHDNHEIRAARAAFAEVARLRQELEATLQRIRDGSPN